MIREATLADWPRIWPIVEQVVRAGETYAYPPDLDSDRGRALWLERAPGRTVVLEEDGRILGTAKMGPNRPGPGAHIATASFMVDDAARGRGVGRALAGEMVTWAGEQGYRGIQFNAVVETNVSAVALWQRLGFFIVGTVPDAFRLPDGRFVGLHVMFRPL